MKQILFFIIVSVLVSCNSGTKKVEEDQTATTADTSGVYGAEIRVENPIAGADVVALLEEQDSVWVTMQSLIVANCKHSGCWMDLDAGEGKTIKVTFKDYEFFIPLESEGKTATVEGFAKREVIPVDVLKHYAEDEGKSQEEIDAITEPELQYTFEAIGVIIEE